MPAATVSNFNQILKTVWPQTEIESFVYKNMPLFAMMPKKTDWSGDYTDITVDYGGMNGRSNTFADAKANKKPSTLAKMHIATSDNFQLWSLDHKLMTLSRNNKGAIVSALTKETKKAMEKFKRSVGFQIFRNGGGSIGRAPASITASSTGFTLTNVFDARNFEVGDVVVAATTDGTSGSVKSGQLEVATVNRRTGALTFTTAMNVGIPTIAASDYLFIAGDFGTALTGISAYVPSTDPSTSIWGMARTADPTRLGGIRVSGSGVLIVEAFKKALTEAYKEGADISHIFTNPDNFNDLDLSLQSQRRYADEKVGGVGFTGIEFTAHGSAPVKVFADPDCPQGVAYGLQMDTWTFHSAESYPQFLTMSGAKEFITEESANSVEGRLGGYGQIYTEMPGRNFYLSLT